MNTHEKPGSMTFDAYTYGGLNYRVSARVLNKERPTGLMRVAHTLSGYDVTIKVRYPDGRNVTFKRCGSLMWMPSGNCAWSLSSQTGLWNSANTMNVRDHGSAWSYRTDRLAFEAMCDYIKRSLIQGPFTLRREP